MKKQNKCDETRKEVEGKNTNPITCVK